jgi:geranylgeranyl reductase family protein
VTGRGKRYDAAIVGCGPGGAFLAYLLASMGHEVLVLEKKRFPRDKTCGGGLTRRAMDLLPFDLGDVIEDRIYRARIGIGAGPFAEEVTTAYPMIGMVMRERFDQFLASKATGAGAVLLEDAAFKAASGGFGDVRIETSRGSFMSSVLVGSDGVHSRVSNALGLLRHRAAVPAVEAEVYHRDPAFLERHLGTVHFDFGCVPKGYGWVFPKRDHLSVGVLSTAEKARGLKMHFDAYMGHKGLNPGAEIRSFRGHLIPLGPQRETVFAVRQGLLVGDAAGLADPITGEGIYHALRQAEIASGVIACSLAGGGDEMLAYNRLLGEEFVADMRYARRLARFLYEFPRLSHPLVRANSRKVAGYHIDIINGTRTYKELFFQALKPENLLPWRRRQT